MKTEKLIIIGSGPAAHTAALYAARATLAPLLYEGLMAGGVAAGGQLTTTTEVENFPGFPEGISGPKLMEKMRAQSVRYGTRIVTKTVTRVDLSQTPFRLWAGEAEATAHALLLATGATAKRLGVEGEAAFWQRGISACAVCDGALPLFRNQPLAVIGGGDTACEEALFLTKYASEVFLIHRRAQLRASKIMQERVFNNKKITLLWNYKLQKVEGSDKLTHLLLSNVEDHTTKTLPVSGLFYAIGHAPNSEFLAGQLALDAAGYVLTKPGSTKTNRAGVFAAGDVQDKKYRQAITAAGSGCIAFMECQEYLSSLGLA